jgi:hypothetical protein
MGIIKKAAAVGAMAAIGALAVKRDAVKKAVRGLIGSSNDAVHTVADKTDELAMRADKALAPAVTKAKAKVKAVARVAKKVGVKKPRAARRKARHAVHAS